MSKDQWRRGGVRVVAGQDSTAHNWLRAWEDVEGMDVVLGMSMAPSTVRMVLVEGKNGDGATVDQDGFPVAAAANTTDPATLTAANQVMLAILGTQEGAAQGGYRLAATGVTCTDPVEAGALRDALAAHRVENIMLVSAFLAAAALAQSFGTTIGYAHTGLLFIEPECATLAVVDSTSGSITNVRRAPLPDDDTDAVVELTALAAGVGGLTPSPQGLFVVGADGVDVGLIKAELDAASPLSVSAPTEPGSALARGAALASAHAPLFDWSTNAVAYAQDPGTGAAGPVVPVDDLGVTQQRAYSAAPDEADFSPEFLADETELGRRPFLVALGVMMVFVFGVAALTIALALDIRPSVDKRPSLGRSVVVPAKPVPPPAPAPVAPAIAPAAPAPGPAAPVAPAIPPVLPLPIAPIPGPGPLAPGPPMPGPGPLAPGHIPGIPHGPGPGLPGIPHGGGGIPHLPGLGGFHL